MSRYVYDVNGVVLTEAYSSNSTLLPSVYDINDVEIPFTTPDPSVFLDTAVITALPSISVSGIKQGACTDGTYIYQICFDSSSYTSGKFIKYKISDGTYTTTSFDGSINFGHGNDMLYNPNNQHIYVACMTDDGAVQELTNTFEYVTTHYVIGQSGSTYKVWQFCYDQNTDRIYITNLKNGVTGMSIYDQNFNLLSWVQIPTHPEATAQGCETDGNYIYRVTYNPNYIEVCTIDGEYVKTINNPATGEPETLSYNWDTGEFYLSKYAASNFFQKIQLYEEDN